MKKSKEIFYATGKRKSAVAKVWMYSTGTGKIVVNGKNIKNYFMRETYLTDIKKPLIALNMEKKYDAICNVKGSGLTGQSGAIRLGISKALCLINIIYRSTLKSNGFLTRDSRIVERKKYGHAKARKKYQFSKR